MIIAIGIYYLLGLIIAFMSGLYCAIVYDEKIGANELMQLLTDTAYRVCLTNVYQGAGAFGRIFLNAVSIAILPFIAIIFGICYVRACDRFVNEKNKEKEAA